MKDVIILLGMCFALSSCTSSKNKKKSYAALSATHKKLADDCMKWADYTDGDPLIWGMDNPATGETRIILNTDQQKMQNKVRKARKGGVDS